MRGVSGPINRLFRTGTAVGLSDAQLLERFVLCHDERAESAFNVLVERHGPMVLAVCRRVLNDPHDAEDAFQATFLVLVRKAGTVRKRESIADWLHGVALRVSAHARAGSARRRSIERRAVPGFSIAYETPPPDIDVRDEIEHLPQDLRAAVVVCYLEGLTHEQAARQLGWPVGTVRSRLARARARLRADLTRRNIAPDSALMPLLAFRSSSLPQGLIDATVKAAILLAARDAGEAGLVSAFAVSLTEGVLRAMLISKLKMIFAILLAVGAITSGVGLYAYQDRDPGAAAGSPRQPAAIFDTRMLNATELDAYAERLEQLVRRARQEQAEGEWDGAVRDLRKSEHVAGEWREALMNRRRSEKGALPPSPKPVAEPLPPERRLDELERKVDRPIHVLEKGRENPEHHDPVDPANERPKPKGDPLLDDFVDPNAILMGPNPSRPVGVVEKIDNQSGRVEINLGSDDGFMRDEELAVYRKDRHPQSGKLEYLGRILILMAKPDQAVAKVIASEGKKIREGDYVSAEIPPVDVKRLPSEAIKP